MNIWYLLETPDGDELVIATVPAWAIMVARTAETIDVLTGHLLCSGGPAWFSRIPVGRPRYLNIDGKPCLDNSLGDLIYHGFGHLLMLPDRLERRLSRTRVDRDFATVLRAS